MQEGGGNRAWDVSGYGNHGTLTNMDPATDHVLTERGRALDFGGTDDRVVIADVPSLDIAGNVSVAVWARVGGNTTNFQGVVAKGDSTSNSRFNYAITLSNTNKWRFIIGNGTESIVAEETSADDGLWHLKAGTADGNMVRIYSDGSQSKQVSQTITPAGNANPLFLATFYSSSALYHFVGSIALVGVWCRALLPYEIQQLYTDEWVMHRLRRRVFAAAVISIPKAISLNVIFGVAMAQSCNIQENFGCNYHNLTKETIDIDTKLDVSILRSVDITDGFVLDYSLIISTIVISQDYILEFSVFAVLACMNSNIIDFSNCYSSLYSSEYILNYNAEWLALSEIQIVSSDRFAWPLFNRNESWVANTRINTWDILPRSYVWKHQK
jgi:hypothetical protein